MASNETKIAFLLNIMEPLLVNDLNNEAAIGNGIIEILVVLLKTQDPKSGLKPYIKFLLRCLTSAIRTDTAVNRYYGVEGGVNKIMEILQTVED